MEGEQCGGMAGRGISEAESSQCFRSRYRIRACERTAIVEDVQTESGWPYLQSRISCLSQESRSMTT
jgi:hypothetical protein